MSKLGTRFFLYFQLAFSMLLAGCWGGISIPIGAKSDAPSDVSGSKGISKQVRSKEHPKVLASFGGEYKSPSLERMLNTLVAELVKVSDDPGLAYHLTILDTSSVNAFALSGGHLYVTRGLLALANDEAEIGAVLAHEMAHISARHALSRQKKRENAAFASRVVGELLRGQSNTETSVDIGNRSLARFSQLQELEADRIGIRYISNLGYDPYASSRFLNSLGRYAAYTRVQPSINQPGEGLIASHPTTPERIRQAIRTARQNSAPGIGRRNKQAYLKSIDGLLFGDSPQEGYVRGRVYVHPELEISITFPQGYNLHNTPTALLAWGENGVAMRFEGEKLSPSVSLEAYLTSGWVRQIDEQSIRMLNINGFPAAIAQAQTKGWSFQIGIIRVGGIAYRMIFASRKSGAAFDKQVIDVMHSFKRLKASELKKYRPLNIKLVRVTAGMSVKGLAARMRGVEQPEALFLILNGLKSDDLLPIGEYLKIVVEN